ncbi:hypothetical protein SO802_004580 [Lithocarpus litseifolius]|uniref:Uncharacterized protein n=1 Tax=Lithocarpus litseifolius TaxID=425828 RepID=A0AAW2E934_9ROSI
MYFSSSSEIMRMCFEIGRGNWLGRVLMIMCSNEVVLYAGLVFSNAETLHLCCDIGWGSSEIMHMCVEIGRGNWLGRVLMIMCSNEVVLYAGLVFSNAETLHLCCDIGRGNGEPLILF